MTKRHPQVGEAGTPCDRDPNCQLTVDHAGTCEIPPGAEDLRDQAARLLSQANRIERGKP